MMLHAYARCCIFRRTESTLPAALWPSTRGDAALGKLIATSVGERLLDPAKHAHAEGSAHTAGDAADAPALAPATAVADGHAWRWRAGITKQLQALDGPLLWRDLGIAAAVALAAAAVAWGAQRWLAIDDLSMIFIVAVILVATRTGMVGVVATAALCFCGYNFFFIEPTLSFNIGANRSVATLLIFLLVALVCGSLASRLRQQLLALRALHHQAAALEQLGRGLSAAADLDHVLAVAGQSLQHHLGAGVALQVDGHRQCSPGAALAPVDEAAAAWTLRHGQAAGKYTHTLPGAGWWFLPLQVNQQTVGVVGLFWPTTGASIAPTQQRLAEAMVDDIAQTVMRTRLVSELERARLAGETERLRAALLSSVSHDLRSPLASMIGSASSLSSYRDALSEQDQDSLLETIMEEGERLDRYIQNLLDMTRLGADGIVLDRQWTGVDELIGSAAARLHRYQPDVMIETQISNAVPPVWVQPALIEQALFNIIDNAARFSPPGATVTVHASVVAQRLQIDVSDRGPGIPEPERQRVFDMFYSVERGDRSSNRTGTGLGLTISQGMVVAHGGSVEAFAGRDGIGTVIRIALPLLHPPAEPVDSEA